MNFTLLNYLSSVQLSEKFFVAIYTYSTSIMCSHVFNSKGKTLRQSVSLRHCSLQVTKRVYVQDDRIGLQGRLTINGLVLHNNYKSTQIKGSFPIYFIDFLHYFAQSLFHF